METKEAPELSFSHGCTKCKTIHRAIPSERDPKLVEQILYIYPNRNG